MKNNVTLLALMLVLLVPVNGSGDTTRFDFIIGMKYHQGALVPHNQGIDLMLEDYISGFEINLIRKATGKNYWESLYNYPYYGAGYFYSNMGNDEVFGENHALYAYLHIPYFDYQNRLNAFYQLGLGGAYLTKKYDVEANYHNQAIGSHFNVFVKLNAGISFQVSPKIMILADANFYHVSSGKMSNPNLGLNSATYSLGFNYHLNIESYKKQELTIPGEYKKWEFTTIYSGGLKIPTEYSEKRYYISTLVFSAGRFVSQKRQINLGLDWFYDPSSWELADEVDSDWNNKYKLNIGIHAGHTLVYNNINNSGLSRDIWFAHSNNIFR
ncbi:MAG: acyloxyacyl hydrolase [Bacteroidales bacterium]|nr:acyloxyacyl hydrolase [Bacteroidales bacterium]